MQNLECRMNGHLADSSINTTAPSHSSLRTRNSALLRRACRAVLSRRSLGVGGYTWYGLGTLWVHLKNALDPLFIRLFCAWVHLVHLFWRKERLQVARNGGGPAKEPSFAPDRALSCFPRCRHRALSCFIKVKMPAPSCFIVLYCALSCFIVLN
jgi:hypothetical protein